MSFYNKFPNHSRLRILGLLKFKENVTMECEQNLVSNFASRKKTGNGSRKLEKISY